MEAEFSLIEDMKIQFVLEPNMSAHGWEILIEMTASSSHFEAWDCLVFGGTSFSHPVLCAFIILFQWNFHCVSYDNAICSPEVVSICRDDVFFLFFFLRQALASFTTSFSPPFFADVIPGCTDIQCVSQDFRVT
jgi:hypothetical protein